MVVNVPEVLLNILYGWWTEFESHLLALHFIVYRRKILLLIHLDG